MEAAGCLVIVCLAENVRCKMQKDCTPVVALGQFDAASTQVECGAHVKGNCPIMRLTPLLAFQGDPVYDSFIFSRAQVLLWATIYTPAVTDIASIYCTFHTSTA